MSFWSHVKEAIGTRGYSEADAERGQRAVDQRQAQADARQYDEIMTRLRAGKPVETVEALWCRQHEQALKRRR